MSVTIQRRAGFDLAEAVRGAAIGIATRWQRHRTQADSDRVLRGLTDVQLRDVGIDRLTIEKARPVMTVSAGLMTNLMTMR